MPRSRCVDCGDRPATNSRDRLCLACRADVRYTRWVRRWWRRNRDGQPIPAWDWVPGDTTISDRNRRWRRKVKGRKP